MKIIDPSHLRRLLPAVLLAAAATLGGSALGEPATACAVPDAEWDIGQYDNCIKAGNNEPSDCCLISGGVWSETQGCVAPPARTQPGLPEAVGPGAGVATQNPAPPPPVARNPGMAPRPGVITTETFAPAPVG